MPLRDSGDRPAESYVVYIELDRSKSTEDVPDG
jgi:hypothetical protein